MHQRHAGRSGRTRRCGFFDSVYLLVRRIPRGKVATYGQIARLLGAPRSARVVGWAMHGNPHGTRVPWHRVVQRGGGLSPAVCPEDPGRQRRLLQREGVTFLLDGRIDMTSHQWARAACDRTDAPRRRNAALLETGRRAATPEGNGRKPRAARRKEVANA